MQNLFNVWVFEDKLVEKLVFGIFGLNSSVFEKLLISYSCISFIKLCALRVSTLKCSVFKKFDFSNFSPIETNPQFHKVSSPRMSNFSQITKLIKLMHGNHVNNIQGQKPIKQNLLKTTYLNKNPKIPRFEIFNKNEWKCMKIMI